MHSLDVDGLPIAYNDEGRGSTLVMVHGACENSSFWKCQAALADKFRIISIDLPGHGKSSVFRVSITVKRYSDLVAAFIAKICKEKVIIVGHSMGGAIAQMNALDHPQNLKGVVLVGTGAKLGVLPEIREGLRRQKEDTLTKIIGSRQFSPRTDPATIEFVNQQVLSCNQEVAIADYDACNEFDARSRLASISLPTLIVVGEDDRMTPVTWATYLRNNIVNSRLVVLKDCSHLPMLERPEEFNLQLTEFVATLQ